MPQPESVPERPRPGVAGSAGPEAALLPGPRTGGDAGSGAAVSGAAWAALAALGALAEAAVTGEDDLFGVIPVLAEPTGQRVLDGWVDAAVDLLRAVVESSDEIRGRSGQ
jgi:hypothetical protein